MGSSKRVLVMCRMPLPNRFQPLQRVERPCLPGDRVGISEVPGSMPPPCGGQSRTPAPRDEPPRRNRCLIARAAPACEVRIRVGHSSSPVRTSGGSPPPPSRPWPRPPRPRPSSVMLVRAKTAPVRFRGELQSQDRPGCAVAEEVVAADVLGPERGIGDRVQVGVKEERQRARFQQLVLDRQLVADVLEGLRAQEDPAVRVGEDEAALVDVDRRPGLHVVGFRVRFRQARER